MNMLALSHIAQDIGVVSGILWWGASFHENQNEKITDDPLSDCVCKHNSRESFGQKWRLKEHESYKEGFQNQF